MALYEAAVFSAEPTRNRIQYLAAHIPPQYDEPIHRRSMSCSAGRCRIAACFKEQVIVT